MTYTAADLPKLTPYAIDQMRIQYEGVVKQAELDLYFAERDAHLERDETAMYTAHARLGEARAVLRDIARTYAEQRWERYWTTFNGKIHLSTNCLNALYDNGYQWFLVASLSGIGPRDAIEAMGNRTCIKCFPYATPHQVTQSTHVYDAWNNTRKGD